MDVVEQEEDAGEQEADHRVQHRVQHGKGAEVYQLIQQQQRRTQQQKEEAEGQQNGVLLLQILHALEFLQVDAEVRELRLIVAAVPADAVFSLAVDSAVGEDDKAPLELPLVEKGPELTAPGNAFQGFIGIQKNLAGNFFGFGRICHSAPPGWILPP